MIEKGKGVNTMARDVNEVIDRAIYGALETKPGERRLFLTTILERLHIALTRKQVRSKGIYQEVEQVMRTKQNLHLYVNAELGYQAYADYIRLANDNQIMYTIVSPTGETPFGLVLANKDQAVNVADPFVKDEMHDRDISAY